MYSLLLALIYIAFISLGLPDSLLGSGWPVIHNDLNVPISFMGVVSMVISGGTIVSSLFSDKLTRKLGARIVTVSSVFIPPNILNIVFAEGDAWDRGFHGDRAVVRRVCCAGKRL